MKMQMEDYIRISPDVMKKNLDNRKSLTEKLVEYYLSSNKKDICIIASGSSLNGAITAEMFMTNNWRVGSNRGSTPSRAKSKRWKNVFYYGRCR